MKSILLVDDETEIAAALARTLRRLRFRVETADTAENALRALERSRFDAVLLEFNLRWGQKGRPRTGTGLEVVRRLRASEKNIPVVIFTAMDGELYEKASLEAGADEFLSKTGGFVHLVARVLAFMRRSERTLEAGSADRFGRNRPGAFLGGTS